jgi:mannitol 2-dehydrogenase
LAADAPIEGLVLVEALWARMCAGTREDGSTIDANDPFWDTLQTHAILAKDNPAAWIGQDQFYGDLGQDPRFAASFTRWLNMVWSDGTEAAIQSYLDS